MIACRELCLLHMQSPTAVRTWILVRGFCHLDASRAPASGRRATWLDPARRRAGSIEFTQAYRRASSPSRSVLGKA